MSDNAGVFGPRSERRYDREAVERFPWPVALPYPPIHQWMDRNLAVHAAWQVRDAWENLLKFLACLAAADFFAAAGAGDERRRDGLLQLLLKGPLSLGHWGAVLEYAYRGGRRGLPEPPAGVRLPQLRALLFRGDRWRKQHVLSDLFAAEGEEKGFIHWRNKRFAHGVFAASDQVFALEAVRWLGRLHDAYDLCRDLFTSLRLECLPVEGQPEAITWGGLPGLPFQHEHPEPQPEQQPILPVRVTLPGGDSLELTPLMDVRRCGLCGRWAAFYVFDNFKKGDKPAKHKARFLDLITGSEDPRSLPPVVRDWSDRLAAVRSAAPAQPVGEAPFVPDARRFCNFDDDFVPPRYLAERVAGFMKSHDRGVVHLAGPGGAGKSWVCGGIERSGMLQDALGRSVPTLRVSMHAPAPPSANDVRAELRRQARDRKWAVPREPEGPTPAARFAGWLAALMGEIDRGELLVVLDGLDELPADSDVPDLLPAASDLPRGCYVLTSGRTEMRAAAAAGMSRAASAGTSFVRLAVDVDAPGHRDTLLEYARKQLAAPRRDGAPLPRVWAEDLVDLSAGSFLYLFHYCRALRFGVYDRVDRLPAPDQFYPSFFDHLRGRVGEDLFETVYARALAFIAVARWPVGPTHLAAFGVRLEHLPPVLDDLADLLRARRGVTETEYLIGHDSIRRYLRFDPKWAARLGAADRKLARLAADHYSGDWRSADPTDPVDRYLLFNVHHHAESDPALAAGLKANLDLALACIDHGITLEGQGDGTAVEAYEVALVVLRHLVEVQGRSDLAPKLKEVREKRDTLRGQWDAVVGSFQRLGERISANRAVTSGDLSRLASALQALVAPIRARLDPPPAGKKDGE